MEKISFIVPCKNESSHIRSCLLALLRQCDPDHVQIIVIDNGSTDGTIDIVKGFGDSVSWASLPDANVAGLRNYGASQACHDWLAFIDADVEIEEGWYPAFQSLVEKIRSDHIDESSIVTGSTCIEPKRSTWLERTWVHHLAVRDRHRNHYINSGHLVVHRCIFKKVGGFDIRFTTGEDERFCADVRKHGGTIINASSMRAIHHGYPKSMTQFFKRERWHGYGMREHLRNPFKYRDVVLALGNMFILVIGLLLIVLGVSRVDAYVLLVLFQAFPLLAMALRRSGGEMNRVFPLLVVYEVYAFAKTVALIDIFSGCLFRRNPCHPQKGQLPRQ